MAERFTYTSEFLQRPLLNASIGVNSNLDWEIVGTNVVDAGSVFPTAGLGQVSLTTTGGAGDQIIVIPHQDVEQTAVAVNWRSDQSMQHRFWFASTSSLSATIFACGIRSATTLQAGATALDVATDDDKVIIRAEEGVDTTLQFILSVAGVDTTIDTEIAFTTDTQYDLLIMVAEDRTVRLIQNDGTVVVDTALLDTPVVLTDATSLGVPFVGLQTTDGLSKVIYLNRIRGGQNASFL